MTDTDPPRLIGHYTTPACSPGDSLVCAVHGRQRVSGLTAAPIPWPYTQCRGSQRRLIVCEGLLHAVATESTKAIAHHWGVNRRTVHDWSRALGFGRGNPTVGTRLGRGRGGAIGGRVSVARKRSLQLYAPHPSGPLRPLRRVDQTTLRKLGWTEPLVTAADYARLVRAALGAGVPLCIHRKEIP